MAFVDLWERWKSPDSLLEREAVNPTLKSLVRLAKALRCLPHELLKPQ
jgi:hypothetical protein